MTPRGRILFSVDVEDWPQSSWDRHLPIGKECADTARRLLDLMAACPGARGTFFVLGKFAEVHPDVVRAIHNGGHEVASHGYGHEEIFRIDRRAFREDLERSTDLLGNITGERTRGYRAPDFSIVSETLWALDVLAEGGYRYDSSIFPLDRGRYGIQGWPREPRRIHLQTGGSIVEFPLTVASWRGRLWPISGGGYARLLPRPILRRAFQREAELRPIPPVFYCHPYEADPDEFRRLRIPIPMKVRLHQNLGRKGFTAKLKMLFEHFECCSFKQAMREMPPLPELDYSAFKTATVARSGAFGIRHHIVPTSAAGARPES